MEIVSTGAFIERKAEANDGRAFAAREEAMAEWASALKDLRSAVDRLGNQLSTTASAAAQICSPRTNINQSLHRLERDTERSVTSSPSVFSSTSLPTILPVTPFFSYCHSHQPEILPTWCSVPPPAPQIIVTASPTFSTSPQYSTSTFANSSLSSNSSSVAFSTTKLLRTSVTEHWPTLTRIEKPHPHASPDFRFEKPPTKFFPQNGLNVEALWASQNVFDGFFRTATDQSKASVLAPDPTLHGLNNSDPAALVIDQTRDAVSHNKGKPPLLSTDDLVQPDAKLEHKKIEAPVLFRCMAPFLHPVNNLEMKILPVPSSDNSANLNANSGQIHICSPHAHGSDFQGISSHGQVSNTCTFSQDSAAKLQDACPIPRRVDVMKLTIEDAEFGQNPRDGHVLILGPELIPDSLPILEMQEPGHQPLIKQFSDQGGVQQYSINRTENPASAQRDVVLGFNPNADINSGDDPLLTQIPAPAAKKMSMQLTEICHSMDHCASMPLYQPTGRLVSVHSVDSSKSAHRVYRHRASYVPKEDYDSTVKGSKQFEILQSVEETESFKISDEHDFSGDQSAGEPKMSHMKVVPAEEDITKVEQELHNPSNLGATPAHRTAVGNLPSQAFDSLIVADKPLVDAKTAKSSEALLYSDGRDVVFGNLSCVQTVASFQKCSFSQQEDIMEKHQEAAGIYSVSYADILKRGLNLNDDEEPGSGATPLELPQILDTTSVEGSRFPDWPDTVVWAVVECGSSSLIITMSSRRLNNEQPPVELPHIPTFMTIIFHDFHLWEKLSKVIKTTSAGINSPVPHVLYSCLAVGLAMTKNYSWRELEYQASALAADGNLQAKRNKMMRQQNTLAFHHALHPWSRNRVINWMLWFLRQFTSSIRKSDYLALRLGIVTHNELSLSYNSHKYMVRGRKDKFPAIVGISWLLWGSAILCIFLNIHGLNMYFLLSFSHAIQWKFQNQQIYLLGYCWEEKGLLLVYAFMQQGSLEIHLFGRGSAAQPLPRNLRLKIAMGASRGFLFLHSSDGRVIYRDIRGSYDKCRRQWDPGKY